MNEPHPRGGRPRSPEGDLEERQRRNRERWRAYSASRYEASRPEREAERVARQALKPGRRAIRLKLTPRRTAGQGHTEGIPKGDTRPW